MVHDLQSELFRSRVDTVSIPPIQTLVLDGGDNTRVDKRSASTKGWHGGCATLIHPTNTQELG
jgi:hypothetical protein